jgi:hypothetical protein
MSEEPQTRCPICGEGTLADIAYDAGGPADADVPEQQPESRQVDVYTCGHQVVGGELGAADGRLDVERRGSEETAEPLPTKER